MIPQPGNQPKRITLTSYSKDKGCFIVAIGPDLSLVDSDKLVEFAKDYFEKE